MAEVVSAEAVVACIAGDHGKLTGKDLAMGHSADAARSLPARAHLRLHGYKV
jgi:hypothetical protein